MGRNIFFNYKMERLLNNKTNRVKKPLAKISSPFLGIPSILKNIGVLNLQNILKQPNIIIYNNFNQTTRNSAYLELIFNMGVAGQSTVYNSFAFKNMKNIASISDSSELIIPATSPNYISLVYANIKRYFMMDMLISYGPITGAGPDNLYFKFTTSNTIFPIAKVESSTTGGGGSNPYVAGPVYRTNMWIYYPYTQIYVLIRSNDNMNSYGFSIWVMQSYTNQIDTTLTLNTLPYIGTILANNSTPLPSNMCFSIINLSQYLNTTSIGNVDVMQDTLNNTYQYLDPTYCNFLYENIVNNNKQ